MRRRAITLLEVMLALAIGAALLTALSFSYGAAAKASRGDRSAEEQRLDRMQTLAKIRTLLEGAFVSPNQDDEKSYFIALSAGEVMEEGSAQRADQIVFTTLGRRVPGKVRGDAETDFEVRNETYGPVGGIAEYSLSTSPVGDAGDATGLFMRYQIPADTDYTQGGYEEVLDSNIDVVGFEFWDGTDWRGDWNTQGGDRRLPAAVRVTYTETEDPTEHSMVVRVPASDITADNPLSSGGAAG